MKYFKIIFIVAASMTTCIMPMLQRSRYMVQSLGAKSCMSSASDIQPGQFYQHYKGNFYKVMTVGRYSEDPNLQLVVYQALYDTPEFGKNSVWVRPLTMFAEKIEKDGQIVPRFKRVDSVPDSAQ